MRAFSFGRLLQPEVAPDAVPEQGAWRSGLLGFWNRYPVLERRRTDFGLWWGNRTPRERRLLVALAATGAIALLIWGIYRPLASTRAAAVADIRTYEVLAAQLRTAGPELARLRAVDRRAAPEVIASTAGALGLTVGAVEPAGAATRVSMQDANFVRMVEWLVQLENSSTLRVSQIQVAARPAPGLVNAQIVLKN